jgi:hypothetical protein
VKLKSGWCPDIFESDKLSQNPVEQLIPFEYIYFVDIFIFTNQIKSDQSFELEQIRSNQINHLNWNKLYQITIYLILITTNVIEFGK